MLKSELYQLEKIVAGMVNYYETGQPTATASSPDFAAQLEQAFRQLREQLTKHLFGGTKEIALVRYVQFHQAGIIALADEFDARLEQRANNLPDLKAVQNEFLRHTDGLLNFLKISFYKFFDHDHPVPLREARTQLAVLQKQVDQLVQRLLAQRIEPSLTAVVQTALQGKLDTLVKVGLSNRQLQYLDDLLRLINETLDSGSADTLSLTELLYRQNFNSNNFISWLSQYLEISKSGSLLTAYVDLSNQFEPKALSIPETMRQGPGQPKTSPTAAPENTALKPGLHMPLNLSVPQFALFIRLCYLENCFHLHNISDIMRFFALNFETKKQLHISVKSFSRAFYRADQATAAVVRDLLNRMIGLIDKLYFPKI